MPAAILRAPTREVTNALMDSHRWDDFVARPDDVVVATYPKCGTTWTQRIVDLLIFQNPEPRQIMANAPWLDCVFMAPHQVNLAVLEAQPHRRGIKSHLPYDALPVFEGVKYIHTVRDGRDACLSMHNHQLGMAGAAAARAAAGVGTPTMMGGPGRTAPPPVPEDPRAFFLYWMTQAETPGAHVESDLPFCEFEQTYWAHRADANLLHVHYADLKADLAGEMARIAAFLEIDTPPAVMARLVEAARFETMKAQGEELMPQLRMGFDHGSQRFLDKGQNGRWKGILTDADLARYDALAKARLTPSHNAWIHGGRLVAGDPAGLPD